MASQSTALRKRGMGRGPNHIPRAPTNPDERTLIHLHPGPNTTYVSVFTSTENFILNIITYLLLMKKCCI